MPDYPLTPDSRTEIVFGSNDYDLFLTRLPNLFLTEQVPEIIQNEIKIVLKLLQHSYFEYEFIDIALTHAIFTMEKALKLRYYDLQKSESKLSLEKLITWAKDHDLVEHETSDVLHAYRIIRNAKVHATRRSLGGLIYLQAIPGVTALINDLHEDTLLRSERKLHLTNIRKFFDEHFSLGMQLNIEERTNLYKILHPVFVDNKSNPALWYFAGVPITDLRNYKASHLLPTFDFALSGVAIDTENKTVSGHDSTGKLYTLAPLSLDLQQIVIWWSNQVSAIHKEVDGERAASLDLILSTSLVQRVKKVYALALNEFYRKPNINQ
jgi:hypothetical protein